MHAIYERTNYENLMKKKKFISNKKKKKKEIINRALQHGQ